MIQSPCVRNCCLDVDDICMGCHRSVDEICRWTQLSDEAKQQVLLLTAQRKELKESKAVDWQKS